MEVILRQDVNKLGKVGNVIKVNDGFARNFLIPRGLVIEANAGNLKKIESENKYKQQQLEKKVLDAKKIAEKIQGMSCTVTAEAMDDERLYGSVSTSDVANALGVEGVKIDKELIHFETPIDKLGIYELEIKLHPEVSAKVRVWVTRK